MSEKLKLTTRMLRKLPAVLVTHELDTLGYAYVPQTLKRFAMQGLIDRKGHGVYYNPLSGQPWCVWTAIKKVVPLPVVIGPSVLYESGVITQIPNSIYIASLGMRTAPTLQGVNISPRGARWMAKYRNEIEYNLFPLPSLNPKAAWRDMNEHDAMYGLHKDDLDFDSVDDLAVAEIPI